MYGVLLLLIFFLQVGAAISAYSMTGEINDMLTETMNEALDEYHSNNEYTQATVDYMQENVGSI